MIFLHPTYFNTTTIATVTSGSSTIVNMIDKKSSIQYQTNNFNNDLTTSTIRLDFDTTQTVSNIILLNHNLKDFSIKYNHPLISSFTTGAYDASAVNPQGIAVATDGTLWICDNDLNNEKIINVNVTGTLISSFTTGTYDVSSTNPTGIAVATDGTLWITDASSDKIYNVNVAGTLISSFTTGAYDVASISPSGIAVATGGTLWICDSSTDKIYNVNVTGTLISSFTTGAYDAAATTSFGLSVATGGTLWICDLGTQKIYNVDITGTLISSFATSNYDTTSTNLTGVAVATDGTLWITDYITDKIYNVNPLLTFTAFSPAINYTTNSATSQYFSVATVTTVENIVLTMNKTITANEEKKVGEFIVSKLFYDFTVDRLPTAQNYRPEIRKKQILHKMSDGGVNIYNIANKFMAKIKLDFVPTSTEIILKSIFDSNNPVIFLPFETTTSWNGDIYEVNWIGGYNIIQFSDNNKGNGYKGQIILQETQGRI